MQWHQTKPWLFRANREPARRKQKNQQTGFTHSLARHTHKNQTETQTAHLSLSLPSSRIKARLTLMRESRVRGGKKRHEEGVGKNYGERSTQGHREACGSLKHVRGLAGRRSVFFFRGKEKSVLLQPSRAGAVASSSKFSRSFCFFFTH